MTLVDLGEPTSFLDHGYLGCTQHEANERIEEIKKMFESRISAGATEKVHGWGKIARENRRLVL